MNTCYGLSLIFGYGFGFGIGYGISYGDGYGDGTGDGYSNRNASDGNYYGGVSGVPRNIVVQ